MVVVVFGPSLKGPLKGGGVSLSFSSLLFLFPSWFLPGSFLGVLECFLLVLQGL